MMIAATSLDASTEMDCGRSFSGNIQIENPMMNASVITSVHLSESECKICPLGEHAALLGGGVQFGYGDILAHRNPKLFVQRSSMLDGLLDPVGMLGHAFANSTRLLFLQ